MEQFKDISIRGRVAYLICSYEKLLLYFNYDKNDWTSLLEKLWSYTSIQYIDEWMYELAEYMPNSILNDTFDGCEYIVEDDFYRLRDLYRQTNNDVLHFLDLIYQCATLEIYSKICDYSPLTIDIIQVAEDILVNNNISLVDVHSFRTYSFRYCNGWGEPFNGKQLSLFI